MAGADKRSGAMKASSKRGVRYLIKRAMRARNWHYGTPKNGLRRRAWSLINDSHRWWDWGNKLMILTGTDFGGNWSEPKPETWFYRLHDPKPMWRTGWPRHPLSTYEVIKDYTEFRARTEGLNEDEMYRWQAIYIDQDGELDLGHRFWGGSFYGLTKWDQALLRRYLRHWRRLDWYGLRSWLYGQGLHAAVHARKPRTCQVTPPKGSGGYSHWYCDQPRKHKGEHRYRNYAWDGDIEHRVEYSPEDQARRVIEEAEQTLNG